MEFAKQLLVRPDGLPARTLRTESPKPTYLESEANGLKT